MGTKKDLGKFFKERLESIEQVPDTGLWNSIASELDKTQSKRIAPLWFYAGGALIVGLLILVWFMEPEVIFEKSKPQVVYVNNDTIENTISKSTFNLREKNILETIAKEEYDTLNNLEINNNAHQVATSSSTTSTNPLIQKNITGSSLISSSRPKNYREKTTPRRQKIPPSNQNTYTPKKSTDTTKRSLDDFNRALALQQQAHLLKEEAAKAAYISRTNSELNKELALQREIAETTYAEQVRIKGDSLSQLREERLAQTRKKTIENKLPKTNTDREDDRKSAIEYEIAISPYTSFLNYGSLTKASSIDDRLVNNPRKAISTVGYGVRVDYTLSERTSLRLGVGFAPLKYQTENFQVSINNGNINIYELSAINLNNLNGTGTTENTPQALNFFSANNVVSIQQNISYIEVPIDFQYRFINKRIAFSVSPGVSMFILNNNEIFATADSGQSIFVGRETNLNGLSLAFNLGLGAHYNINDKWRLNAEPVFRYQLNPYSNTLSNFRPYYIGAQFGMSYKF